MITIFTVPKFFKGVFNVIQRNAITSWTLLEPKPEIILCGDDKGVTEFAEEKNLLHIPDIKVSEKGTPYLSDVFLRAHELSSKNILVYSNCDIIFMSDLIPAIKKVVSKFSGGFLIIGQRFDTTITSLIDFTKSDWEVNLRKYVWGKGKYHSVKGIDYFVFRKGFWEHFPSFIVGRPRWDMWFVSEAIRRKHSVVNATRAIFAIHQKHDYSHIGGGLKEARYGSEARYNAEKAVSPKVVGSSIQDANYKIEDI